MGIIHPSHFCYKELAELYTLLSKLKSYAIKCETEKKNNNHFPYARGQIKIVIADLIHVCALLSIICLPI